MRVPYEPYNMPASTDNLVDKEPTWIDWDGSPLTKHAWYAELPERLRKYRTFWERGYLATSKGAFTVSPNHSYHLSINNVKKHTFAEPNPLGDFVKAAAKDDAALAKDKESRYTDAPDVLAETDTDLFDIIAFSISNRQKRKDYFGTPSSQLKRHCHAGAAEQGEQGRRRRPGSVGSYCPRVTRADWHR